MSVYLSLRVTRHYLHLDLHAAVRELLNHALDPYERLHLSGGERERERESVSKVKTASASLTHITTGTEWMRERERQQDIALVQGGQ